MKRFLLPVLTVLLLTANASAGAKPSRKTVEPKPQFIAVEWRVAAVGAADQTAPDLEKQFAFYGPFRFKRTAEAFCARLHRPCNVAPLTSGSSVR